MVRRKEVPDGYRRPSPLPEGVTRGRRSSAWTNCWRKSGSRNRVSDAVRKIKAGAVEINGEKQKELILKDPPPELIIHVGKQWRKVV